MVYRLSAGQGASLGLRAVDVRVLLTGGRGMLGCAFANELGADVLQVPRPLLEPSALGFLTKRLRAMQGDVLINCAAHVDAEAAEIDAAPAVFANSVLPGVLAGACREIGLHMVHFSSTGCYGDWKMSPYDDDDPVRPTTAHHRTKAAGEARVRAVCDGHLILRTGWLFGGGPEHRKNFVWRRLEEAASRRLLRSDDAQRGNPTYIGDVVRQTLLLLETRLAGTFNCVSQGAASRYEYVRQIVQASGLPSVVEPCGAFERLAPVSMNEAARNHALALLGLDIMPDWRVGVDAYVASVLSSPRWNIQVSKGY